MGTHSFKSKSMGTKLKKWMTPPLTILILLIAPPPHIVSPCFWKYSCSAVSTRAFRRSMLEPTIVGSKTYPCPPKTARTKQTNASGYISTLHQDMFPLFSPPVRCPLEGLCMSYRGFGQRHPVHNRFLLSVHSYLQ